MSNVHLRRVPAWSLWFAAAALGCGQDSPKPAPPGGVIPGPKARPVNPEVRLSSVRFAEEFGQDRAATANRYRGKWIELSGKVTGMGRDIARKPQLTLEGAPGDLLGVLCFTTDPEPWKRYAPGQQVKLVGRFANDSGAASLTECAVTEASENPAPVLTAAELARDFNADQQATTRKFDQKYLLVTGEVVAKEENDGGAVFIDLKGDGKTQVRCIFTAAEKESTDAVKVGRKVRIVGEYSLNLAPGVVNLRSCFIAGAPK